jgi:hypothetical protein
MIGKSWFDYIQIRCSIAALRSVAPLSIVYLGASCYAAKFLFTPVLGVLAIIETLFFTCIYLPRRSLMQKVTFPQLKTLTGLIQLQKATRHPPPLTRVERQALFEKCTSCTTDDSYPAGWFTSDITRENATEWILWALFSCDLEHAKEEWAEEIDIYIQGIEKILGRELESSQQKTGSMRLTFDPVVMVHRPLIWYNVSVFYSTRQCIVRQSISAIHRLFLP